MADAFSLDPNSAEGRISDLKLNFKSAADMAKYIATPGYVDLVDATFCDPMGLWHHCTFAPSQCKEDDIVDGFPFDGSSIKLFKSIEESDMIMVPDISTCWMDPFYKHKVVHVTCHISTPKVDPQLGFSRCPRSTCLRAMRFLKDSGIADIAYFGPEPEFFVFDSVQINCVPNHVSFQVDFEGGPWNNNASMNGNNLGHRLGFKQNYFPVTPIDRLHDLRSTMLLTMGRVGVPIEKHHAEVAACQYELGITCREMLESADNVMTYKYVVKNEAARAGKSATFMPKPLFGDNGSGMHVHQSLWKNGRNLFYTSDPNSYCYLSEMAMHYIGGLLKHAHAVLAFTSPTVNSYKRLVPGFEAPTNLIYSKGNRSAAIRIPLYRNEVEKAKRIEFRCPDPTCCVYLAYAVMLMAGLDGIKNKTHPGDPSDIDIYHLSAEDKAKRNIKSTPHNLNEALDALERDHDFLLVGNVFTKDFILAYIAYKRAESLSVNMVPSPKEYELYYAC